MTNTAPSEVAPSLTAEQLEIQSQLAAANINPESFLATDYLNHFNEIVMVLEMIGDMPDMIEEALEWQPKSYPDHFRDSGFQDRDLAVLAYEKAPGCFVEPFEAIKSLLDRQILVTVKALASLNIVERGLSPQATNLLNERITGMQALQNHLSCIIHGGQDLPELAVESHDIEEEISGETLQTQEDIDKLFD